MKSKSMIVAAAMLAINLLSSCNVYVVDAPGPDGRAGFAYFGVDYDTYLPYSYSDNNPAIPFNPVLGNYYNTQPGTYEFEYFVNPYDYWYGTYSVYVNLGEPGGANGYAGRDGRDTHLMLICNPNGFYEVRGNAKMEPTAKDGAITITSVDANNRYTITMQRANVNDRPARMQPKLQGNS